MSVFLCTADGDLAIIGNRMWLTDNSVATDETVSAQFPDPGQATLQLIRNNLRMAKGEEPLNTSLGIPYFQQVLQKETPLETVQAIFYQAILGTPGVTKMIYFNFTLDNETRQFTITFTAETTSGPVTFTETFP